MQSKISMTFSFVLHSLSNYSNSAFLLFADSLPVVSCQSEFSKGCYLASTGELLAILCFPIIAFFLPIFGYSSTNSWWA